MAESAAEALAAPKPHHALRAPDAPGLAPLLSVAEVGTLFGRSALTLRRWAARGFLVPVRVGRSMFYRADDVAALVRGEVAAAMLRRFGCGDQDFEKACN